MKPVYYLLIVGLLASTPVLGLRRKQHSQLSQVKKFSFWPTQTYNETQNNLSLTIHPLSEEETSNLFLGEGKRLLKIKGWFFSAQPITPLHITIKNEADFPVVVGDKNIDLGKKWFFIRNTPVNLANVMEALNNAFFWSDTVIAENSYVYNNSGQFVATATSYHQNPNNLLYRSFLTGDGFPLSTLCNLDSLIFHNDKNTHNCVMVGAGDTKEMLIFVWATELNKNFSITLAKNRFAVDLFTPQPHENGKDLL